MNNHDTQPLGSFEENDGSRFTTKIRDGFLEVQIPPRDPEIDPYEYRVYSLNGINVENIEEGFLPDTIPQMVDQIYQDRQITTHYTLGGNFHRFEYRPLTERNGSDTQTVYSIQANYKEVNIEKTQYKQDGSDDYAAIEEHEKIVLEADFDALGLEDILYSDAENSMALDTLTLQRIIEDTFDPLIPISPLPNTYIKSYQEYKSSPLDEETDYSLITKELKYIGDGTAEIRVTEETPTSKEVRVHEVSDDLCSDLDGIRDFVSHYRGDDCPVLRRMSFYPNTNISSSREYYLEVEGEWILEKSFQYDTEGKVDGIRYYRTNPNGLTEISLYRNGDKQSAITLECDDDNCQELIVETKSGFVRAQITIENVGGIYTPRMVLIDSRNEYEVDEEVGILPITNSLALEEQAGMYMTMEQVVEIFRREMPETDQDIPGKCNEYIENIWQVRLPEILTMLEEQTIWYLTYDPSSELQGFLTALHNYLHDIEVWRRK